MEAEKYVGWVAIIMYQDKAGTITQRSIRILEYTKGKVRAYDISKRSPRVFDAERILALQPISRYAS